MVLVRVANIEDDTVEEEVGREALSVILWLGDSVWEAPLTVADSSKEVVCVVGMDSVGVVGMVAVLDIVVVGDSEEEREPIDGVGVCDGELLMLSVWVSSRVALSVKHIQSG